MAEKVSEIRKQIDTLDDKIHDLLMKRADLVVKIGAEKRKNGLQIVQPDREIVMLRRLLARHRGPLPKEAIVRLWRELVGAVSLLQTGLKVTVTVPEDHTGLVYWDMAKDYFSSVLPIQKVSSPMAALAMVREGEATFAVLPWPENEAKNPWWSYLMDDNGGEPLRIIARLPLGDKGESDSQPEWKALVVARLKFESSGQDRSFIALDVDSGISRGRIVDKAAALSLTARSLHSGTRAGNGRTLHLLEVDQYVAPGDPALAQLLEKLECSEGRILSLGGYPVPPVYGDKIGRNAVITAPDKKSA